MYKSSEHCDLTLKLQDGRKLKVHKVVVSISPFFQAACTSGFRVSLVASMSLSIRMLTHGMTKESIENLIKFPEDPSDALELLIMLLYGFTWAEARDQMFPVSESKKWGIVLLPQIHALATKYQVPGVANQVINVLKETLNLFAEDGINT